MTSPRIRRTLTWGGIVVSGVFVWLAVRHVDLTQARRAISEVSWWWVIPSALGLAAAVATRVVRWYALFEPGSRPPLGATSRALLVGLLFNAILPARAGDAIRIVVLAREAPKPASEVLGTAAVERLFDVLCLLVLLAVAAPMLPSTPWIARAGVISAVIVALAVVAILVLPRVPAIRQPLSRLLARGLRAVGAARLGAQLAQGLAGLRRGRVAFLAVMLTVGSWLLVAVSAWAMLRGFHLGGLGAALLVTVATNLAMVIPSSPASVGPFEAAVLVALSAYGIDNSQALPYAVLLHALNFFPFLPLGYAALHMSTRARRGQQLARSPRTLSTYE